MYWWSSLCNVVLNRLWLIICCCFVGIGIVCNWIWFCWMKKCWVLLIVGIGLDL